MSEYRNGFEFLKALKEQTGKSNPGFTAFSKYLRRKAREQGIPLDGQFELTPLCNFRCKMCYVQLTEAQMSQRLLKPTQWKDLISQAVEAGMLSATLSGGECLTYPGFREVYEHLQHLGCEVEVFSNGSLLDEDWIQYFKLHPPAGLRITLYGDSEDAYERVTGQRAFQTVVRHLRQIREANIPLRISITPSKALGEDVFGTVRLAKELSQAVIINHRLNPPREETGRQYDGIDMDEDYYIRILKYSHDLDGVHYTTCSADLLPPEGGPSPDGIEYGLLCGAGRSGFDINWKGIMSPCNELDSFQVYPLETGFSEAWQQIRKAVEHWPRSSACNECPYEPFCESCAAQVARYAEPGKWPHALCKRTKRFVREGVYPIPECK